MGQAQTYARLERHMDYQARIKDVLARVDMELRQIATDLERDAKETQRYGRHETARQGGIEARD